MDPQRQRVPARVPRERRLARAHVARCGPGDGEREGPSREGDPAHFTAGVTTRGRAYTAVFECATGRERVRFSSRWRSGFSSCGRFVAYFPARGDRCVLVELATLARRDVQLALGRTVVGLPLVDAGARTAVVLLRTRKGDPRAQGLTSVGLGHWELSVGAELRWDLAARWTPVWVGFGASWHRGDDPLPWAAHRTLWDTLGRYADHVRYHRRLGGVRRLPIPLDPSP